MSAIKIHNENWMIWDFWDHEEFYGLAVHDKTYLDQELQPKFRKEYYLKVLIPEAKCVEGKFPSPEAHMELNAIDEALVKLLAVNKVDCKKVHWYTYYGAKRFIYEVNDIENFEKCVQHWKGLITPYQLKTTVDPPWTMYNHYYPNEYAWIQHNNRQLITQLEASGTNPEKVHHIAFNISGKIHDMEKLTQELQNEGGKTIHISKNEMEISFDSVLDPNEINDLVYYVHDNCKQFNCKYEGWSTGIVK